MTERKRVRLVRTGADAWNVYYPGEEKPRLENDAKINSDLHARQTAHRLQCDLEITDFVGGEPRLVTLDQL